VAPCDLAATALELVEYVRTCSSVLLLTCCMLCYIILIFLVSVSISSPVDGELMVFDCSVDRVEIAGGSVRLRCSR
jgi:hypothetical protein